MKRLTTIIEHLLIPVLVLGLLFVSCKKDGGSSGASFDPQITSINPDSGPVGTSVTINGSDFDPISANNEVFFNGTSATVNSSTTSSITTTVPEGATSGAVSVVAYDIEVTGPVFTIDEMMPSINRVTPDSAKPGDEIRISGMNFSSVTSENEVFIGEDMASVVASSDTSITAIVPESLTEGTYGISVSVNNTMVTYTGFKVFEPLKIIALSGDAFLSCGLDDDGIAYCWGGNSNGELGNGSFDNSDIPVQVSMPSGVIFTDISVGNDHVVALSASGEVWSWGENNAGQLGTSSVNESNIPVLIDMPSGVLFNEIKAGTHHSLALTTNGKIWAWGNNFNGSLGDGSTTNSSVPVLVNIPNNTTFKSVHAGNGTSFAITDDGIGYAWGFNDEGQLGIGNTNNQSEPVILIMPSNEQFTKITSADEHTIALTEDGEIFAWGLNDRSQLGDGSTTSSNTPIYSSETAGRAYTDISAGARFSIAIASGGQAWSWGANYSGTLGIGNNIDAPSPVMVNQPEGVLFTSVTTGNSHNLAIGTDGRGWAWGNDGEGERGDGPNGPNNSVNLILFDY